MLQFVPYTQKIIKPLTLTLLCAILSACLTKAPPVIEEPAEPVEKIVEPSFSSSPIIKPSINDVRFAQSALKEIGYKIGKVDGIWGKRSSSALQSFEASNGLLSAGGALSALNLHNLETVSGLLRQSFQNQQFAPKAKKSTARNIADLLNKDIALSRSAQLVILEKNYQTFSKPNPYSSKLFTLSSGTGVYIISQQDGWYKIETLEEQIGYVKVDS